MDRNARDRPPISHQQAFRQTAVAHDAVGGFAAQVYQTLSEHGALDRGLKIRSMILPDVFIDQDSPAAMYAKAGLDAKGIVKKVFEALGRDAAKIEAGRLA